MKNQRDKLKQYQKRITVITDREQAIARECLRAGNKDKALLALRRKKYQESLLLKTDQQLAQLEALTSDVEFALVQKDVVFGLQQGTSVLKEIHKEMGGLEKVEMILGESEEAQAYQKVRAARDGIEDMLTPFRKSRRCWAARCRIRTKTRWRMNSKRWSGRLSVYRVYPMRRTLSRRSCLTRLKLRRKKRRKSGGRRGRQENENRLGRLRRDRAMPLRGEMEV